MTAHRTGARPASERRLYHTPRWRRLRALQLARNPLCHYCEQAGRVTPADTVDHIRPHKGDEALFWDEENLESLCAPCHNSAAALKDMHGYVPGARLDGEPLDPGHPWAATKSVPA